LLTSKISMLTAMSYVPMAGTSGNMTSDH